MNNVSAPPPESEFLKLKGNCKQWRRVSSYANASSQCRYLWDLSIPKTIQGARGKRGKDASLSKEKGHLPAAVCNLYIFLAQTHSNPDL